MQRKLVKAWDYDVIVNGGSIVGASLVASLVKEFNNTLKICVVDQKPPPIYENCIKTDNPPDFRVYALSPKSIRFLNNIGAWKYIKPRSQSYNKMQIWETLGPGVVRFDTNDFSDKSTCNKLGAIAEDSTILASIYKVIYENNSNPNVHFMFGSSINSISVESSIENMPDSHGAAKVTITNGKSIDGNLQTSNEYTCRLVVGADGGNSIVRKLSDIKTFGWSYGQEAIVSSIKIEAQSHAKPNTTAYQRYLPTGPIAMLPLWGEYASIVWSLPVSEAKRVLALPPTAFKEALNTAFQSPSKADRWSIINDSTIHPPLMSSFLPTVLKRELAALADTFMSASLLSNSFQAPPIILDTCLPRVSFPLNFSNCSSYIAPRVALIGDAAHSIHPQAGQGLNLGLGDADDLSNLITHALNTGGDIGDMDLVLKKYHTRRYLANLSMMGAVDVVNTIFSDGVKDIPPSRDNGDVLVKYKHFVRSFGMLGIHSNKFLKSNIAKFAMGI